MDDFLSDATPVTPTGSVPIPARVKATTDATGLIPAVKFGRTIVRGEPGETHDDIIKGAPHGERGFVDKDGKWLSRDEASKRTGAGELHSTGDKGSPADFLSDAKPATPIDPIVGVPDRPLRRPSGPTELHRDESWGLWGVKRGIELGGIGIGGAVGTAMAIPPAVVTGQPIVAVAGARAGEAAGLTTADVINAELDKSLYGRNVDLGTKNILKDYLFNLGGSIGAERVMHFLPGIVSKVLGTGKAAESLETAVEEGGVAQRQYQEKAGEIGDKVMQKAVTEQGKAAGEAEAAGRQEIIKSATGATPETAGRAMAPPMAAAAGSTVAQGAQGAVEGPAALSAAATITTPSPEALAKMGGLKGTYFGIKNRLGEVYGGLYENLLGKYSNSKVQDTSEVQTAIGKWDDIFAANKANISPGLQRLVADAQDIAPKSFLDRAAAAVRGPVGRVQKELLAQADELPSSGGATVAALRGLKQKAVKFSLQAQNDTEAQVAEDIAEAVDKTLEKTGGLPTEVRQKLAGLNQLYRDYKLTMNRPVSKAISMAEEIPAVDEIFSNPKLTQYVAANATDEEKATLKRSFGEWAASQNPKRVFATTPAEAEAKARAYGMIVPNTPFANPKSLMYVSGVIKNLEDSPVAMGEAENSFNWTLKQMQLDGAKEVRNAGLAQLKKLGPIGTDVIKKVQAAKSPLEQAEIIDRYFNSMTPESFAQQIGAKQAITGPSIPKMIGQAPFEEGRLGTWMIHMMQRPGVAKYYIATALMSTVMYGGKPSPFWLMMAVGSSAAAGRRMFQNLTIKTLAREGSGPIMSALSNRAFTALGNNVARATMTDALAHTAKRAANFKMESGPADDVLNRLPLSSLGDVWSKAQASRDGATEDWARNLMIKRLKSGEWKKLDPAEQRKIGPLISKMLSPKSEAATEGAGT